MAADLQVHRLGHFDEIDATKAPKQISFDTIPARRQCQGDLDYTQSSISSNVGQI